MSADPVIVKVAKDLEDLVPVFMQNREKELVALRAALAGSDYEQLRQLGHRMKGVGNSYGFEKVSLLGKEIEDAAKQNDTSVIGAALDVYADYLSRVQVEYE